MALYKQYEGSFVAKDDSIIKVQIYHENTQSYTVGELTFPADRPLVIEWESDKTDTIIGASAQLTIVSPGDRTYTDLYTVAVGAVLLKVYRNDSLFWVGTLDTEFYEEPYSRLNQYEVTLTFSDFGMLKRRLFNPASFANIVSVKTLINTCLNTALGGIYNTFTNNCSTTVMYNGSYTNAIEALSIRADNFVDEEDEPQTLYDVLEAVLKPLALRIQQRAGAVEVYDFNAKSDVVPTEVYWSSDDATLAVDETYNRVVVTLSPYAQSQIMQNTDIDDPGLTGTRYQIDTTISNASDRVVSFYYRVGTPAQLPSQLQTLNRPMIDITGEKNIRAVAAFVANVGATRMTDNTQVSASQMSGALPSTRSRNTIYKTKPVFVAFNSSDAFLRIEIPMMFDGRYCPFADDADGNEQGSRINTHGNAIYLNCRIKCGDYYLVNNPRAANSGMWHYIGASTSGAWVQGTPASGWTNDNAAGCICSLMYYNLDGDQINDEQCGALGWASNKQPFGNTNHLDATFQKGHAGLVCYAPPVSGELTIEILDDLVIMDADNGYNESTVETAVYKQCRYWLIGLPAVDVVTLKTGANIENYKADDIEESGYINALAKDELSIDTICGCAANVIGARGAYYSGTSPVSGAIRASIYNTIEQLLIGTIYSQFADQHIRLTGTVRTPFGMPVPVLSDAGYPTKKFIVTQESLDLISAESEITLSELSPDSYSPT